MASSPEQEPTPAVDVAAVEQFMQMVGRVSPRMKVRCALGIQRALEAAIRRHDVAEAATLSECLRRLRALLHEHGE